MSEPASFTVPEKRLADALGLPRGRVKDIRADSLEKGIDWTHAQGGEVRYSQAGIERTLAALQIPPEKISLVITLPTPPTPAVDAPAVPPPADSPPNDQPPAAPVALDLTAPALAEVTVTRCFTVNRHLVEGTLGKDTVRVRVRSSEKIRAGMVLACERVEEGLYQFSGRPPRRIGTP